jgi:hypothetical protein
MVFTTAQPFPVEMTPMANIAAVTYRDGTNFMREIAIIKRFLNESLVPEFNEGIGNAIVEFQNGIRNSELTVENVKADWTGQWTQFMLDVEEYMLGVTDDSATELLNSNDSQFHAAVNALITATATTAATDYLASNPAVVSAAAAAVNANATIAQITGRELPDRGRALVGTYPTADSITTKGSWAIWTAGDATTMGFPFPAGGRVDVFPIGSVQLQRYTTAENRPRQALRIYNGATWQPWASGTSRYVGDIPNTAGYLQTLTIDGEYTVPSGTTATTVGLPGPASGVVRRTTYGAANYVRLDWLPSGSEKEYVQHYTGTWGAWMQKNAASAAAGDVLPAYAGVRAKTWDRFTKVFNGESDHIRRIRNGINGARFKNKPYRLVFLGDSKTAGAGIVAPGRSDLNSIPAQVMDALGATDGFIYAGNAYAGWTSITGFDLAAQYDKHYRVNTSGVSGSITLPTIRAFTGYTLYAQSDAGATISATVDGGAPQTLTIPAGAGWQAVAVTGLGNTTHTIVFTTTGGVKLLGVDLKHSDNLFTVTNAGRSGSSAVDWTLNGAYDLFNTATGVIAPDAVIVNIGTNTGSSVDADITTVINKCNTLGIPVVVAAFGGIASSTAYDNKRLALYGAADTNDLPLIDYTAVIGNYDVANAAGLMNDTLHENQRGYTLEASALMRAITR